MVKVCNLCGSTRWRDQKKRVGVRCATCDSVERTRAVKLTLDFLGLPSPGARILHFAPEKGLASWLKSVSPAGYDPVDFDPSRYSYASMRKFDLVNDCASLPSDYYDLILHVHVLEHVPCNLAHIFFHLTRALSPDGRHVFCVPLRHGFYEEDMRPLAIDEATRRFGQWDHVRSFGKEDIERSLGMLIDLRCTSALADICNADTLDRFNIPEHQRSGLNASTIFVTRKLEQVAVTGARDSSDIENADVFGLLHRWPYLSNNRLIFQLASKPAQRAGQQ